MTLDIWPPLSIMIYVDPFYMDYREHDNIIAELERHDRITIIRFSNISSTALENLLAFMHTPFPSLKELGIWGELMPILPMPVLPETFLGGSAPRLRSCALHCISFPALPAFLKFACQLSDLTLIRVPDISPRVMATCLAALPNLKTLFLTLESDYIPSFQSPPLARANLPALTRLNFDAITDTWKSWWRELMPLLSVVSSSPSPWTPTFPPHSSTDSFLAHNCSRNPTTPGWT